VADTLLDARDAITRHARTLAPAGARHVLDRFARHDVETRVAARELAGRAGASHVRSDAPTALLVGCGYLRAAQREARDALDAAVALTGEPVALVEACCGLPLRLAGDKEGFARHAASVASTLAKHARVLVVDPGCALALKQRYPEVHAAPHAPVELLVELGASALARMKHVPHEAGIARDGTRATNLAVRWHDPCQLGRGLGIYEAPRAILGRALGRAPDEFHARRERAACSGAGGLLPSTMPEIARGIARARLAEHAGAGGGRVVTACASSLIALRKRAAADSSSVAVDDLVTWMARALA
jgi:Fe-S oxidoreductase